MAQFDITKIVLTDSAQSIFERFYNSDEVFLSKSEFSELSKEHLVDAKGVNVWFQGFPEGGAICTLTSKGQKLRSIHLKDISDKRTQASRFRKEFVLSVLAFIEATIALIISGVALYHGW